MQTLSGTNSLLLWNNTGNGTTVATDAKDQFLKDKYLEFFTGLSQVQFSKKFCTDFLDYCTIYEKIFKTEFKNFDKNSDHISKVWNKFRGNVAEILIEYFFIKGVFSNKFDCSSYTTPLKRSEEDFTDAHAAGTDGLWEGIQIKNYTWPVGTEPFVKAKAQWAEELVANKFSFDTYILQPRQHIISFTQKDRALDLHNEFDLFVDFIGPNEINKLLEPRLINKTGIIMLLNGLIDEIKKA